MADYIFKDDHPIHLFYNATLIDLQEGAGFMPSPDTLKLNEPLSVPQPIVHTRSDIMSSPPGSVSLWTCTFRTLSTCKKSSYPQAPILERACEEATQKGAQGAPAVLASNPPRSGNKTCE